jgi:hypothetical protein
MESMGQADGGKKRVGSVEKGGYRTKGGKERRL